MHHCIKFILFWNDTLHVSDGLSFHHQEFKTLHTAVKHILLSACQQADSIISLTDAYSCMYSHQLLMMDEKTVRNYVECHSKINKFDTVVHIVGFTIEIRQENVINSIKQERKCLSAVCCLKSDAFGNNKLPYYVLQIYYVC